MDAEAGRKCRQHAMIPTLKQILPDMQQKTAIEMAFHKFLKDLGFRVQESTVRKRPTMSK